MLLKIVFCNRYLSQPGTRQNRNRGPWHRPAVIRQSDAGVGNAHAGDGLQRACRYRRL